MMIKVPRVNKARVEDVPDGDADTDCEVCGNPSHTVRQIVDGKFMDKDIVMRLCHACCYKYDKIDRSVQHVSELIYFDMDSYNKRIGEIKDVIRDTVMGMKDN